MNKRILIIDSMNLFMSNFIVNPTISTNGVPLGGLVGTLKSLQKYIREMSPNMVIFCFDGEGGSKRKRSINKTYKDGRKPPKLNRFVKEQLSQEENFQNQLWQLSRLTEYLEDLPIYQLIYDKVEGDDLVAFVARLEMFVSDQKIILSSDKDFYQLLDNKTIIYRPVQKEIMNVKSVLKRYGIDTNNFCLARSMAGDDSDHIEGVKGVGLKTVSNRFPFLAEEKNYNIQDIEKYCDDQIEHKSKLKVYNCVKDNIKMIKENYSLMQLFSPSISIQDKDRIKKILKEQKLDFKQASFQRKQMKDQMDLDFSFETLYTWCRKIIKDQNET